MCSDLPEFPCGDEQELFHNQCGCGCIDAEWPPAGPLAPGFEDGLTEVGGCSDMHIYAFNLDDTVALFFQLDGAVAATYEAGGSLTRELDMSDDPISLEVQVGEQLTTRACNDAVTPDQEPRPSTVYVAAAGSGTLVVSTEGEPTQWGEYSARAPLTLTDVVFEPEADGEAVTLEHLELVDVAVGWLPG